MVSRALLTAGLLHCGLASAADWRYCLAQDEDSRNVYVTAAFRSDETLEALEARFNAWLKANEIASATGGICPRSISPYGPEADIRAAPDYNRGLGIRAVRVN